LRPLSERIANVLGENQTMIADLSALNSRVMRAMIGRIRGNATASGRSVVPVVLENHTKDIGDFGPFEEFAAYVASQPDLEVITLQQLHENLQGGLYEPIVRERRRAA
jgi:hypothetical protein